MPQRQLSRTLPKNFTFSLGDEPRTPERPHTAMNVPPPPRHSISNGRLPRVRARAGTNVCARMDMDMFHFHGSDVPLPSIEVPQSTTNFEAPSFRGFAHDEGYLAPPRARMDFKTPPAQIRGTPFDSHDTGNPWPSWDHTPGPNNFKRPDSACSSVSNSSIESIETFASRPSVGSFTSVESDLFDSYFPLEMSKEPEIESPSRPQKQSAHVKASKKSWTRDMDTHLWNTYQIYLQDPTMTPFKMTPGSIPPLGVTSRVARRAKKTWGQKSSRITESVSMRSVDPDEISTPKAMDGELERAWPKSDSKTRRRLKMLCRRKFSISPHYQRIMQSRTPEPVAEMFGPAPDTRVKDFADNSAYTTRDLGVSLVTSSEPTPLSRVTQDLPSTTDWFNNPVFAHVEPPVTKTPSQHLRVESAPSIPRLGSPFVYSTWGPGGSNRQLHDPSARRETIHVPGYRARRNTYFDQSLPNPDDVFASVSRQQQNSSDRDVERRLEDYVRDNKFQDMGHGRVRVRNRGATTSAVNPRDMDQLFSPPSSLNSGPIEPEETTPVLKPPMNPLLDLGENIKRLGSPFRVEGGHKRREAPKRVIRAPALSDPFSSGGPSYVGPHDNTSPMQVSPAQVRDKAPVPLPYNASEDGLSDAERIRRQILNMPFTRN
ncbi:hypothetical protein DTO013E5_8962 [Penicillium roqueforti]|uniref:Uncharacterized protein n=1 Tax=Penicillium roqueforti (strain FM164) TaxID=1365484 RepID=W6QHB8_PENRF|nr:uncharacterized protein LCP9604111_9159 [Penicillium roqueforti]CDM36213.1 unnamed protein product [Penicillium roqueforti FM164]KAF9239394.1 hypothetical protein LCP9604111_9159 [Penicillium roqueforti]KAI1835847.1 hypothetical protein CBS147337_2996 [Penicillium roqueforti]KAI2670750.1 hypothetical protein CBS147355_9085 [Penicillium roqueforti]KAI2684152.1 hypothetical protein LCP963914a_5452 [Penicillium roqueforti]